MKRKKIHSPLNASPVKGFIILERTKKNPSSAAIVWCHSLAQVIFNVICWYITTTNLISVKSVIVNSHGLEIFKSTFFHIWELAPEEEVTCPFQPCSTSWRGNKSKIFSSRKEKNTNAGYVPRILHDSVAWRRIFGCTPASVLTSAKSVPLLLLRHVPLRCMYVCTPERNRISATNAGALSPDVMRCIPTCTYIKVRQSFFFCKLCQPTTDDCRFM